MCRFRVGAIHSDRLIDSVHGKDILGSKVGDFAGPGATKHYPPEIRLEPQHLDVCLSVNLEDQTAEGTVTTVVRANDDGASELALDAVSFTKLVVADPASGKKLPFFYDGRKLKITWPKVFTKGEERKVAVSYKVHRPISGLMFSKPSTENPNRHYFAATDHETERAKHWLPCIDLPNVRTTLDFKLTADQRFTILANGALVNEVKDPKTNTKTAHWKLGQKCPSYLVCFAIGDFVRYDDAEFEGIPVAAFATKDFSAEDIKRSFGRTRDMLAWMTKKLDLNFPFPKYFQFALPHFGGAMENISLVSWSDYFVLDAESAKERTWLTDQVNLHEMAHSYFGDLVVVRDFAHAWLKESWATYMESCWLEDSKGSNGPKEMQAEMFQCAQAYFQEADSDYSRPLVTRDFKSSWQMYDRHLYPGGACRLHTLRKQIGDKSFWRGVQEYLKRYAGRAVETEDFRRAMEEHSGRSLVKFFDQWIYTAGYPDIKVTFEYDPHKKSGTFVVDQKQADPEKGKIPYDFVTDVGWTVEGKDFHQEVHISRKTHEFKIPLEGEPSIVRFDPFGKVLHKLEFNPGEEMLKNQITDARDVAGKVLAAYMLCNEGRPAGIKAVLDAYKKEDFWATKKLFITALGKSGVEEAVAGLVELCASEKDPMVLQGLFAEVGKFSDPRIVDILTSRLEEKMPPSCKGNLIGALGAQRQRAPLKKLLDFAAITKNDKSILDDRHGIVEAALYKAIAQTLQAETGELILEKSFDQTISYRARPGLAIGLATIAKYSEGKLREAAFNRLGELARIVEDSPEVPMVVAKALASTESGKAIPGLETLRRTLCWEYQVAVDKLILSLQHIEVGKAKGLEEQFHSVVERLRNLEVRLQKIEELPQHQQSQSQNQK